MVFKEFIKTSTATNLIVQIFFSCYLIIGSFIVFDYGISIDEPIERQHGIVLFDHINSKYNLFPSVQKGTEKQLEGYDHRDYGMIFQLVAYSLERLINIDNSRDVFWLRHALTFLLFWISTIFFFKIVKFKYNSWIIGLLGTTLLILSPRIFADSFYNPKDIPLLSFFIISIYTLLNFLRDSSRTNAALHALTCSLAISTRVVGVFLPAVTGLFIILEIAKNSLFGKSFNRTLTNFFVYAILLTGMTILFWPILWYGPIEGLSYAFDSMKRFRWYGSTLYWGDFTNSSNLPWHYIPSWILVTTPIVYTIFFLVGSAVTIKQCAKTNYSSVLKFNNQSDLIFLICTTAPVMAIIFFQSVLYNGWRHLYFIYPTLILISLKGLVSTFEYIHMKSKFYNSLKIVKLGLIIIWIANLGQIVYFMIRYHPYQYVYFNSIAGDVFNNFEQDYYGLSYKQALSYLLEYEKSDVIKVYSNDFIGKINIMNFDYDASQQIQFTSTLAEADYFLTVYVFRGQNEDFDDFVKNKYPYNQPEIYSVKVKNSKIVSIFNLKHSSIR